MNYFRILLFPFRLIYGFSVLLRNLLFNINFFRQHTVAIPTIVIGNLSVGGSGKTPHIEYLIRLLKTKYQLATLSRGYKRKTRGFMVGDLFSTSAQLGDEPLQLLNKFRDIVVAVDKRRVHGIQELCYRYPKLKIVLLDDAFQHRSLKPGLSILLTDYFKPYYDDYLLPAGRLRESTQGAKRADIIVVTKSPRVLSPIVRKSISESIKPLPHQSLYFSYIRYGPITPFDPSNTIGTKTKKANTILLFAGIADTWPLEEHLNQLCFELVVMKFADHHQYTPKDISSISHTWGEIISANKLLVTTEKDAMRLKGPAIKELVVNLPVHYIPIEVEFHEGDKHLFDKQILDYARTNRRDT